MMARPQLLTADDIIDTLNNYSEAIFLQKKVQ